MAKRGRMEKARPAREKLTALPELPLFLEDEVKTAENALLDFLATYKRQPMRWGLAPFEELVAPYMADCEKARRKVLDYCRSPEKYLAKRQAFWVLQELKDIVISERHSRLAKQPRGDLTLSGGHKWTSAEIAAKARTMGYVNSSAKDQLIEVLVASTGKSRSTVQRALREHQVSKRNRRKPTD